VNYVSFALAASLRALSLGRRGWDAIFVFQTSPVTSVLPAAVIRWRHGTPVATWVQDLWPDSLKATGFGGSRALYAIAGLVSGWLYRRSDRVLGTSRAFLPRLVSHGVDPGRFVYLPQWAESLFAGTAGAVELPPGPWSSGFPVMFAGNLGRVQSLDTILDAATLARDDDELRWVFVGDGSRRNWLEQEVVKRGLQEKVFLLGRRPASEMPAFFAKAGAMLVSLQRDETMSLTVPAKIQAYLAAARPIVASMDGEGARIIEESGAGFVAPAGDAPGLAQAVLRMKSLHPAQRAAMGEQGRTYSDAHFARERCLDEVERVLRDMVAI
jgi:glycosyltransferase involved in cell wall biosynthesis